MAGEKRGSGRKSQGIFGEPEKNLKDADRLDGPGTLYRSGCTSTVAGFINKHALSLILFFLSLFFIIAVTNPAIFMNDEWITANQLHQLNTGHQLILSEGKYGVTQNGTVSAYFTYRQNILMYSLALPVTTLPVVKLFALLGDNFRLIVILSWSLCLIMAALLLETVYPAYSRIHGVRVLFLAILMALMLFLGNTLLYKQFPFSPADAPFEVAALVFTNEICFALMVSVIFETLHLVLKNSWMALFRTFATISSSSFLFWAATAKDHMLTALVFSLVIFCFIRYLDQRQWQNVLPAFIFSGLLIWIRPEVGFFVTVIMGLFFAIPLVSAWIRHGISLYGMIISLLPATGVFLGAIPFFVNNFIINRNWLIPAFDLPRNLEQYHGVVTVPLPLNEVVTNPSTISDAGGLNLLDSVARVWGMILHAMLNGFTPENLIQGFIGIMMFPKNQSIGFLVMCPLVLIALCAGIFWWKKAIIGLKPQKEIPLFLFLMIGAVFFSYLMRFSSMNTSLGVIPDMRYLSPAYIPCGLLGILVLSKTRLLKKPDELLQQLLTYSLAGFIVILPVFFFIMLFIQPFGNDYPGYSTFFKVCILITLVGCLGTMTLSRIFPETNRFIGGLLPYTLVPVIITSLSFQIMLTSFYGMLVKVNGYPFWIPLIREGVRIFIEVRFAAPV